MSKDAESPGDSAAHGGEPHQPTRAAYGGAAEGEGSSQSRLNPDWGQERGCTTAADGTEPHPLTSLVIVIILSFSRVVDWPELQCCSCCE